MNGWAPHPFDTFSIDSLSPLNQPIAVRGRRGTGFSHFPGSCNSGWPTLPGLEGRGFDFSFFPRLTSSFAITGADIFISLRSLAIGDYHFCARFAPETPSSRFSAKPATATDFPRWATSSCPNTFICSAARPFAANAKGRATRPLRRRFCGTIDECQQVGVNRVGLGRGHAMRKALVGFHRAIP